MWNVEAQLYLSSQLVRGMMFSAAALLGGKDTCLFCMKGVVSAQFLVIFVKGWVEQLDGSHFRHKMHPRLLQDLKVSHVQPGRGGKA